MSSKCWSICLSQSTLRFQRDLLLHVPFWNNKMHIATLFNINTIINWNIQEKLIIVFQLIALTWQFNNKLKLLTCFDLVENCRTNSKDYYIGLPKPTRKVLDGCLAANFVINCDEWRFVLQCTPYEWPGDGRSDQVLKKKWWATK